MVQRRHMKHEFLEMAKYWMIWIDYIPPALYESWWEDLREDIPVADHWGHIVVNGQQMWTVSPPCFLRRSKLFRGFRSLCGIQDIL